MWSESDRKKEIVFRDELDSLMKREGTKDRLFLYMCVWDLRSVLSPDAHRIEGTF